MTYDEAVTNLKVRFLENYGIKAHIFPDEFEAVLNERQAAVEATKAAVEERIKKKAEAVPCYEQAESALLDYGR